MHYLATYCWQSDCSDASSMTLQQVTHKKMEIPIVLACICTDRQNIRERRLVVEELTDWFYEKALHFFEKKRMKGCRKLQKSLEECLRRLENDVASMQLVGVLCLGNAVLMFQKGEMQLRLLNTRNQRPNCKTLRLAGGEDELVVQEAEIAEGAGIMLATRELGQEITTRRFAECLNIQELQTVERARRRLEELAKEKAGAENGGSILLVAQE